MSSETIKGASEKNTDHRVARSEHEDIFNSPQFRMECLNMALKVPRDTNNTHIGHVIGDAQRIEEYLKGGQ